MYLYKAVCIAVVCAGSLNSLLFSDKKSDFFTDFSNIQKAESKLTGKISKTFGFSKVKGVVADALAYDDLEMVSDGELVQNKRYSAVVTMRLESFFSSITENESSLSLDAKRMLENEEYVNFFTACGPNYVRSIYRAKEVTSIISFEAYDEYAAQTFADALRLYVHGNRGDSQLDDISLDFTGFNFDLDFDVSDIRKSLSIETYGFGLGLNAGGSDTLVSTSLDEFNEVMRFAFDTMTKSESNGKDIGMIYGIEVMPWADNSEFLRIANVDFNSILVPVPRSLIENANPVRSAGLVEYKCQSPNAEPDEYGKCCDPMDIVNVTLADTSVKRSCQPMHYLSPTVMKDNLETNAEFVSWMASATRRKAKKLSSLNQCVHKLRSLPKRFEYNFMKTTSEAFYEKSLESAYTLKEIRSTLDPLGDLSILSLVGAENSEYDEMFSQPCLAALYGRNLGKDRSFDPKYFMAEPYYNHKECAQPSCLENDMVWDRKNGNKCVPGVLGRKKINMPIPSLQDPHCAKKIDPSTGSEVCKYLPDMKLMKTIDTCRERSVFGSDARGRSITFSLSNLIDYFCMPQIDFEEGQADYDKMNEADLRHDHCVSIMSFQYTYIWS